MHDGSPQVPLGIVLERMNANTAIAFPYTMVLDARHSAFQQIQVLETPGFGRLLRLDGTTMTSEADEFFYHENLVHVPAIAHKSPARAAIIGGGDGGALREILKHECVKSVSVVEIDSCVVELSKRHLQSLHQGAFDDPRVTLHFRDGSKWLRDSSDRLDLLLLDLTDPKGPAHDLHTDDFYRTCRARLAKGGVLGLHVQSPVSRPQAFARIMRTLSSVFPAVRPYLVFVPTYGTWFGMATASMDVDPLRSTPKEVDRRIKARNLKGLRFYNAAVHLGLFALPNFVRDLLAAELPLVTPAGPRLDEHEEFASAGAWGPDIRHRRAPNS